MPDSAHPPLSPIDDVANMFAVDDYMFFYAGFLTTERSNLEAAQIAQRMGMMPDRAPLRVLDLACGFGRIANRLALIGHQVTGIEYLPGFLDLAREEARQVGVTVNYQQGDMRQLDATAEYDRVLMVFNSFGYFTDAENLDVLWRIARALKPGGRLGFDIANRDATLSNFHPHYVTEQDGALMINRFSFDVLTGRLHNDRIIIRDGQRRDRPFSIRLYSVTEIREVLAQAGLALEAVYAEWDGSSLEMDSPAMVVTAVKPEA